MTQPFQYNNFVQSQIAVGPGNISSSYGAQVLNFLTIASKQ